MRKIEQAMIDAIKANRNWQSSNTAVTLSMTSTPVLVVTLHGNPIARRVGEHWSWSLAGWNTPTTRSRVNAIARAFNLYRVTTKAGLPFAIRHDHSMFPIDECEWVSS